MNRLWTACCLAVALLATGVGGQQPPLFRGSTDFVPVYVTVTDKSGRLVTTLARDDFNVLDNGRSQALTLFDNSPQPVHLVVMLDISGSMYGNLGLLRDASEQLFARLGPDDVARVGSFGKDIAISKEFTHDAASLTAALPTEVPDDAPTPLWTALDAALETFKGISGRRVVLVLSDGKDSGPLPFHKRYVSVVEVMERAQNEEVMIYAVGLRSRNPRSAARNVFNMTSSMMADMPDPGLASLAHETGAGYFEIKPGDDLSAAFTRVVDELHSQYLLGFAPPARDGKRHKIDVRLGVADLSPRARRNYVAPKGS